MTLLCPYTLTLGSPQCSYFGCEQQLEETTGWRALGSPGWSLKGLWLLPPGYPPTVIHLFAHLRGPVFRWGPWTVSGGETTTKPEGAHSGPGSRGPLFVLTDAHACHLDSHGTGYSIDSWDRSGDRAPRAAGILALHSCLSWVNDTFFPNLPTPSGWPWVTHWKTEYLS